MSLEEIQSLLIEQVVLECVAIVKGFCLDFEVENVKLVYRMTEGPKAIVSLVEGDDSRVVKEIDYREAVLNISRKFFMEDIMAELEEKYAPQTLPTL